MEHSSDLLKKNNDLMGKLKNVKVAAKLRKKTNLKPIQQNVTRWTSSFDMVNRYFELKLQLEIFADDRSFVDLLLSPRENNDAEQLKGSAEKLLSVTKTLVSLNLVDARILFNAVLNDYEDAEFVHYLQPDSPIIQNPQF